MLMYAGKKMLQMLLTLWGVVTLVFFSIRLIPGDASAAMAGDNLSAETVALLRERMGLDQPLWKQYTDYVNKLLHMDFGMTITTSLPIKKLLLQALPVTITIALCTMVLGVLMAIPLGTLAAYMANKGKKWLDNVLTWSAMLVDLMPSFWMALLLMLLFSLTLKWLPATGPIQYSDLTLLAKRLTLPILILSIGQVATLARITRTAVLEVLNEDYIRSARAMGLGELKTVFRHALRNALLPIVTVVGISFGHLLNGTVITEFIFAIPGVGTLLINGINSRDYPLVQNVILVYASLFIVVNIMTDMIYKKFDPRIRF